MADKRKAEVVQSENKHPSPKPTDPTRSKRLVRAIDIRLIPLCAWIYLLNYLDRGKHRQCQGTQPRDRRFTRPSDKHYTDAIFHRGFSVQSGIWTFRGALELGHEKIRPSVDMAINLTLRLERFHTRLYRGPNLRTSHRPLLPHRRIRSRLLPSNRLPDDILAQTRGKDAKDSICQLFGDLSWSIRWLHCLRHGQAQWNCRTRKIPMAIPRGRSHQYAFLYSCASTPTRFSSSIVAIGGGRPVCTGSTRGTRLYQRTCDEEGDYGDLPESSNACPLLLIRK